MDGPPRSPRVARRRPPALTFTPTHATLDPLADNYSESVLFAAIAPDARSGVFARLCRYPDAGVAWIWVHAASPEGSWTFVDDNAACTHEHLDLDADNLEYSARPAAEAAWTRTGPRHALTSALLRLNMAAKVEATFEPLHASGATLPGRSEVLGRAHVRMAFYGVETEFDAVAQWHEQEQSAPRFLVPFTYASLLSKNTAMLAVIGPQRSGGFLRGEPGDRALGHVDISPAGDGFAITAHTDTGEVVKGTAAIGHEYDLPVYGRRWRGTFVTAEVAGTPLAGFVNRWDPEA